MVCIRLAFSLSPYPCLRFPSSASASTSTVQHVPRPSFVRSTLTFKSSISHSLNRAPGTPLKLQPHASLLWNNANCHDGVDGNDDGTQPEFLPLNGRGLGIDGRCALEMDDEEADQAVTLGDGGGVGGASSNFGGDGNGGGDGDRERDDDDRSSILSKYGKTELDLPEDVRQLNGAALDAYLSATRGGLTAFLARLWSGWRRRVAADPEFPFKLLMEQTVGLGLTISGMIAARGKNILNELDFALCDTMVGATMNFVLVYLLTPVLAKQVGIGGAVASTGGMAALPANMFAKGQYSMLSRVLGFMHKSALFSVCGFAASIVGTSVSQALVSLRPKKENSPELPNLFVNSAAWAGFMMISSSPRYQAVAGLERAMFQYAPETIAKIGSGVVRTGNNVLGGATWVMWAKAIGLQKSSEPEREPVPLPAVEQEDRGQVAPPQLKTELVSSTN